jgi:hypothetical protein
VIRALAALALTLAACKGSSEEKGDRRPAPITASERERGVKACTAYVERLCACAKDKADLARDCERASSRVETLEGLLQTSDEDRVSNDVLAVQLQARKIIANCVEDMSELDRKGCP